MGVLVKVTLRTETAIKAILILWFIIAMYLQHRIGLADNGDFSRSMNWITSGPIGIEPNWPSYGTEEWSMRFFNYWIPNWKLDWTILIPSTSAFLLWLPGALLNQFLYSSDVLYLPLLSLLPKLILFGALILLFEWIKLETRYKTLLLFSLGVPAILLFTTTDYVAYLNSFYQESASFVYLLLLLVSLLLLRHRPSRWYLLFSLASILLLATTKRANVYWTLLAIPLVIYTWSRTKDVRLRTTVLASLALITLFTFAAVSITEAKDSSLQNYAFHSLFYGALTFSDNPAAHLRDLGMNDATKCIDTPAFTATGIECVSEYRDRLSYLNTINVIYREPVVMFRMLKYVLDNMQVVSLDYLGKFSIDDPRSQTSPPVYSPRLNLWAELKFQFFPKGYALSIALIAFAIWFILSFKRLGIYQDFALVGLMVTIACVFDMTIAILGDGKQELVKHLFLSNVLFDIAAIVFLSGLLLFSFELVGKKLSKSVSQNSSLS